MSIANQLKQLREAKGLSQREVLKNRSCQYFLFCLGAR
jgi:hypothetical protein